MQCGGLVKDIGPILRQGAVYQRGYGCYPRPYYGRGFGSVFRGVLRFFQPLLVKGLKTVGNEVLKAGSDILMDIDKKPVKELVKTRGATAYENLKRKAINKFEPLVKGEGKAIKRKRVKRACQSVGRPQKKKTVKKITPDIFSK